MGVGWRGGGAQHEFNGVDVVATVLAATSSASPTFICDVRWQVAPATVCSRCLRWQIVPAIVCLWRLRRQRWQVVPIQHCLFGCVVLLVVSPLMAVGGSNLPCQSSECTRAQKSYPQGVLSTVTEAMNPTDGGNASVGGWSRYMLSLWGGLGFASQG